MLTKLKVAETSAGDRVFLLTLPQGPGYPTIVIQPVARNVELLDTGNWRVEEVVHWHLIVATLDEAEQLEDLDTLIGEVEAVYEANQGWSANAYDSIMTSVRFVAGGYPLIFGDIAYYGATMEIRAYAETARGGL